MHPRACISIDLDGLAHYCRIHGLPERLISLPERDPAYGAAAKRFRELFAKLSLTGTLFAIGADLHPLEGGNEAAQVLKAAVQAGFEIGNHSQSHDYGLARRLPAEIAREVQEGHASISAAVGVAPVGFRAPGYALSADLYGAVCQAGYLYDSSTFPSAPYYGAKALVMGALAVLGRPSRAVLDSPRVMLAPRGPYYPDPARPYRRGDGPVLELPITTAPVTRAPFIGTFVTSFPTPIVRALYRTLRSELVLNFELHALDFLDQSDGIPDELVASQRDLSIPVAVKLRRLETVFGWLKDDFEVCTLADATRALKAEPAIQ
jgi:peptidoglycan-N-acetylglucosamine deacetylase